MGSLSAYSAARIADLTWGNRPAASPEETRSRRSSLKLPDDTFRMSQWLAAQARSMHLINVVLVVANLGFMAAGHWVVRGIAFIGGYVRRWGVGPSNSLFEGAVELYLVFSFAWLVQQSIGLCFHALMSARSLFQRGRHGEGNKVLPHA